MTEGDETSVIKMISADYRHLSPTQISNTETYINLKFRFHQHYLAGTGT